MKNNKYYYLNTLAVFTVVFIIVSCESTPEYTYEEPPQVVQPPVVQPPVTPAPEIIEEPQEEIAIDIPFDPSQVTEELHASTREEVSEFIDMVNHLIKDGDYHGWEAVLSPEYIAVTASSENLSRISDTIVMRSSRIVLRTLEDYFVHVVGPSRASVNTDDNIDIEFISERRVRAFSIRITNTGVEQRVMLYELEKVDNSWTILN